MTVSRLVSTRDQAETSESESQTSRVLANREGSWVELVGSVRPVGLKIDRWAVRSNALND